MQNIFNRDTLTANNNSIILFCTLYFVLSTSYLEFSI